MGAIVFLFNSCHIITRRKCLARLVVAVHQDECAFRELPLNRSAISFICRERTPVCFVDLCLRQNPTFSGKF